MKIKVVTLNVWHGGRLWDEMISFLRAEDPDILLAQEVYNSHDPALEKRFRTVDEFGDVLQFRDHDYALDCLEVFDFGKVEEGSAIFSKFPIVNRYPQIFYNEPFSDNYIDVPENYPKSPHSLQHVTVDTGAAQLDVFNIHGVWDKNGTNDSSKRLNMSRVIVENTKDLKNVIAGGDMNVQRNSQTIRNIEAHLTNVFGDELATSFNLQHKNLVTDPGYATATVDMMFVSPDVKVVDHYAPDVNVSDHMPLVTVLEVPEA